MLRGIEDEVGRRGADPEEGGRGGRGGVGGRCECFWLEGRKR